MTEVRIGIAQWHPRPGDPERNLRAALEHIGTLAGRGAELVVLPELWPCGYDPATLADDAWNAAEPLDGPRGRELSEAARTHGVWLFAGSVPERSADGIANTAVVYGPDGVRHAAHRKRHLYTPSGEHRVFAAGDRATVVDAGPFGTVGIAICFDGDRPAYAHALRDQGARVVVAVAAYEIGAERWWNVLYPANALVNGQWWVMANQRGGAGDSALFGGSQVLAPDGDVALAAPRGPNPGDETDLVVGSFDLAAGIARADAENAALWEVT